MQDQRWHGRLHRAAGVKSLIASGISVKGSQAIVLGLTFKENCPDLRHSKVIDVIRELGSYGVTVHVHGPPGLLQGGVA